MWRYKSPIGYLYIKQLPDGLYGLEYQGVIWEACDTPEAEADNVFQQVTGCDSWDLCKINPIQIPRSLCEWEEV